MNELISLIEKNNTGIKKLRKILQTIIHEECPRQRKVRTRYTTDKNLIKLTILYLKTGQSYREVSCMGHISKTYLTDKINDWNSHGIFTTMYDKLRQRYVDLRYNRTNRVTMTTIIDAAHIRNQYGTEDVSYHQKEKSKKATKVSIIIDDAGAPMSLDVCKASIADVKRLEETVNKLPNNIHADQRQVCLLGDAGYIGQAIHDRIMNSKHIKVITKRRRNQQPNSVPEERKLRKRIRVERQFSVLKYHKHLRERNDKKTSNFSMYVQIALCCMLLNTDVFQNMTDRQLTNLCH